jgi:hypothetical protein
MIMYSLSFAMSPMYFSCRGSFQQTCLRFDRTSNEQCPHVSIRASTDARHMRFRVKSKRLSTRMHACVPEAQGMVLVRSVPSPRPYWRGARTNGTKRPGLHAVQYGTILYHRVQCGCDTTLGMSESAAFHLRQSMTRGSALSCSRDSTRTNWNSN